VVPQELVFDPFFSVRETLRIQSGYFGIRNNDDWIDEILANLDLTAKADTNMRRLSGGMKRRVLVAQALVHKPPVIVLDEPTAGVDVELRQGLWQFVRRLNRDGHTVILTTHYLEEAESLCGRIAMLKQGRVVALDSTSNLLARFAGQTVTLRLAPPAVLPQHLATTATVADGAWTFPRRCSRDRTAAGGAAAGGLPDRGFASDADRSRGRLPRRHAQAPAGGQEQRPMTGFRTLLYKEVLRFWKVSFQTVGAPVLTALLYLMIFSHVLERTCRCMASLYRLPDPRPGDDVGAAERLCQQFVEPDPVEGHRQRRLRPAAADLLRRVLSRLCRRRHAARPDGRLRRPAGDHVVCPPAVEAPLWILAFIVLGGGDHGRAGDVAGIWADKFDQLAGFQNFLIMPLTMLSGVFYSIHSLPEFWQQVSRFNPVFYMIDGFRFGFFGVSDVAPEISLAVVATSFAAGIGGDAGAAQERLQTEVLSHDAP
jgi:energy-coupling factor transporter ATP-binding protein EcfA2